MKTLALNFGHWATKIVFLTPKGQLLFWSNLGQTGKKHLVSNNFCAPIFVLLFLYFKSRGQISRVRCAVVTRLPSSEKLVPSTLKPTYRDFQWEKFQEEYILSFHGRRFATVSRNMAKAISEADLEISYDEEIQGEDMLTTRASPREVEAGLG